MLTELSALLDLLKAKGVTRYEGPAMREAVASGGEPGPWRLICVEFPPPGAPVDNTPEEAAKPQDMCKCGHPLAEHQGGLCMHACEEEKCS